MSDSFELARKVDEAFRLFGIHLSPAVAGFLGAMISLRFLTAMTAWQVWATLGVGFITAGYVTPIASTYISWPAGGLGFAIGFLAMGALGAVMALINEVRAAPTEWIRKWIPKKGGDQ